MNYLKRLLNQIKYPKCIIKTAIIKKNVTIGDNSEIYQNVQIDENCEIGKYNLINQHSRIYPNTITGNFVSIAPNVKIAPTEHPIHLFTTHPIIFDMVNEEIKSKLNVPVITKIGNDVWIGTGAIIKKGIIINDGAVIGAGAVVTKDVPPYAIVGGVPAKIIKFRFSQDIINELLKTNWWNKKLSQLHDYEIIQKLINNNQD